MEVSQTGQGQSEENAEYVAAAVSEVDLVSPLDVPITAKGIAYTATATLAEGAVYFVGTVVEGLLGGL